MAHTLPEGYFSAPPSGTGSGILVLHAWWGLNDTIKEICDRLSAEGFIAFAPDLYNGKLAKTIAEAEALSNDLDSQQAMAITKQAVDFLSVHKQVIGEKLGVVGFSLGAYFALGISAEAPDHVKAVVVFYGTGDAEFEKANAAYLGHFAVTDPYEPAENIAWVENALLSSGHDVTFYRYEAVGHWFFERDRLDAYDARAAQLAWDRTLSFLKGVLKE